MGFCVPAPAIVHNLPGLQYFRLLGPLCDYLHAVGTARDRAGNRQLFYDQYATLLLFYLKMFQSCGYATLSQKKSAYQSTWGSMITQVLHCPYCHETDIVRHGKSPEGKQRYRCRACPEHGRTFLLEYTYAGQSPDVKQQIVDMAMNASGIRDTARVLHVSPTTVIKELKKRNLCSIR